MQLQLVLALSVRAQSQAGGVSKVNAYINVVDVFATHVLPEIQVGGKTTRTLRFALRSLRFAFYALPLALLVLCFHCALCILCFSTCACSFTLCVFCALNSTLCVLRFVFSAIVFALRFALVVWLLALCVLLVEFFAVFFANARGRLHPHASLPVSIFM